MEFTVPLSKEDLRVSNGRGGYKVSELLTANELTSKIEECQVLFAEVGPSAITECFDIFYNVIHHFTSISQSLREYYWSIIIEALVDACHIVDNTDQDSDKLTQRSSIKMLVYVMSQFVEEFENFISNQETLQITKTRKAKKTAQRSAGDGCGAMWEEERERVINVMTQFLEQNLVQLWDPPTPEMMDDVTGLIAGCCYKFLENPVVGRDKDLRGPMANLLGLIIKKYNQSLSVSVKLVQLLQHFEHLVTPLCQCIKLMVSHYQIHHFVADIIREIGDKDSCDLSIDTSGTKNYATFIVEISQVLPQDVSPCIDQLMSHLGGESYTMRIAVLSVLGEIVAQVLTGPDIDGDSRSLRDTLLDKLQEHIHDVNAFARSKVLQAWLQLCHAKAIPLPRQKHILESVLGRLKDKSSQVRKNALQLLTAFVTGNPFASKLDMKQFKKNLQVEKEKLESMLPPKESEEQPTSNEGEEQPTSNGEGQSSTSNGEEEQTTSNEGEEQPMSNGEGQSPTTNGDEEQPTLNEGEGQLTSSTSNEEQAVEVAKQMAVVHYHNDAVTFIEKMSQGIPLASQLLGSKLTSDILESLEFLAAAQQFDLPGAHEGIRKALVLVWSSEQSIRDVVMNIYIKQYLCSSQDISTQARYSVIVGNLLSLVDGATLGELASLEEMIVLLMKQGHLPKQVLGILWDVFAGKVPGTSSNNARHSIMLIAMATRGDPDVVRSNLNLLLEQGLKKDDLIKARWSCIALQRMISIGEETSKFPSSHSIFTKLSALLVDTIDNISTSYWCPLAEQVISTIYQLSEQPDTTIELILRELCYQIFGRDITNKLESSQNDNEPSPDPSLNNPLLALSRLLFVFGHTAKQHLVYLEVTISKELKKHRQSSTDKSKTTTSEEGTIEDEMGLTGAAADDIEAELIRKVCTEEVCDRGLLGALLPLVVAVVTKPSLYPSLQLQTAATLALSKYMLVSSKVCEKYLRVLFTLLENSPEAVVRANIIVALGDLTVRYPNIIEPWTSHLYSRLQDPVYQVRQNTIIVLTHLILNDMVKVKGQISEMALCLEDPQPHIVDRAKLFFLELSRKGNALYNVLPDIISHLSDPCNNVLSSDAFRNIMKYLFSFIQKDKQSDGLVEKLCHRFRATRTEQQSQDLAFCLSQINLSERGLKKLQDNFSCYQSLLSDVEVYNTFIQIITRAKKFAKPELKTVIEEFEARLTEVHCKGLEQQQSNNDVGEGRKSDFEEQSATQVPTVTNQAPATPQTLQKSTHNNKSTVKKTPAITASVRRRKAAALTPATSINVSAVSSARRTTRNNTIDTIKQDEFVSNKRKGRQRGRRVAAPVISDSDEEN